jgi:hypothetical protein
MHPVGTETRYLNAGSNTEPASVGDLTLSHTVLVVIPSGDGYCAVAPADECRNRRSH